MTQAQKAVNDAYIRSFTETIMRLQKEAMEQDAARAAQEAADDDLDVQDGLGNMLWKIRAACAVLHAEGWVVEMRDLNRKGVRGLNIATIDGGVLYVHLGSI